MSYKLGSLVLLEIVDIVRRGLVEGQDVSELLRQIEVSVDEANPGQVKLSDEYSKRTRGVS